MILAGDNREEFLHRDGRYPKELKDVQKKMKMVKKARNVKTDTGFGTLREEKQTKQPTEPAAEK